MPGLLVEDELLGEQVQDFAIGGEGDGAGAIDGVADIVPGDFAEARAEADAATAVDAADVGTADGDDASFDDGLGGVFGRDRGAIDGCGGRREVGDESFAHAGGVADAVAAITQRALVDFGDEHADFRAARVEDGDDVVLLSHVAPPVWCGVVGDVCALVGAGVLCGFGFVRGAVRGRALWVRVVGCGGRVWAGAGCGAGSGGIGGHLQHHFTVVAEIDGGETADTAAATARCAPGSCASGRGSLRCPKCRSRSEPLAGTVARTSSGSERSTSLSCAEMCSPVAVQVGDESLIDVHARAANGERIGGVDAADDREGVVAGGHLQRGHGEEHAVGVGELDAAVHVRQRQWACARRRRRAADWAAGA